MLVYCIFLLTVIVKFLNMINPNMEKKEELTCWFLFLFFSFFLMGTCWFLVLFTCRLAVIVKVLNMIINPNPVIFKGLEVTFFEYLVEDGDSFQAGVLNGHGILLSSLITVWSISESKMYSLWQRHHHVPCYESWL